MMYGLHKVLVLGQPFNLLNSQIENQSYVTVAHKFSANISITGKLTTDGYIKVDITIESFYNLVYSFSALNVTNPSDIETICHLMLWRIC